MGKRTIIPFGPQHPVLPEPVHLDLVLEDEKVVEAIPRIGYIHRGLEKLVEKKDFKQFIFVTERICGICSFGHGYGYATAVEALMGIEVPKRAEYLRVIWHELSRIHSHLLWLGLLADGFGYESLFMHCWRLRERILDVFEQTTGARVIVSANCVGGCHKDIPDEDLPGICNVLDSIQEDYAQISRAFLDDESVNNRMRGVGVLSKQEAFDLTCIGPFGRASGIEEDIRMYGFGGYSDLAAFEPVIATEGDCYARCKVRIEEVHQSIDIIKEIASKMPEGEIAAPVKGNPPAGSEALVRIEQPRGEAVYYAKGNGTKFLDRMRIRTPTSMNLGGLTKILQGCDLADVPMAILTIDPCISCTER